MQIKNEIKTQPRSRRGAVAFLGAMAGNWVLAFTSYVLFSWFTQDGFSGSPVMLLLLKLPDGAVLGAVSALCWQHFKDREFDKAVSPSLITGVLVLSALHIY